MTPSCRPLTEELEARDFEVLSTPVGDGGLELYKKHGPFAFVLTDCRLLPGVKIKDGVQLVTAIHRMNSMQRMAITTTSPKEVREKLPLALRYLPVLRKHFRLEQVLRLLRQPILPFLIEVVR
jgi:CheY-like chemotaxis protein